MKSSENRPRLFKVVVSNRARKSLRHLHTRYSRRVLELLVLLQNDPVPAAVFDVKKLAGMRDTYRIR